MKDIIKSLITPHTIMIVVITAIAYYLGSENYSLKQDKQHLQEQLQQADAIIHQYQDLYAQADTSYSTAIDSANTIKHLRDENNTKLYNYSADSLEQLWAELYSQ